jgi:hypothetical protein
MLGRISALARIAYTLLAVVAGIAVGNFSIGIDGATVTTALIVLGLIAGITIRDSNQLMYLAVAAFVLPVLATTLASLPQVGTQLSAIATNLGIAIAGAVVAAVVFSLYDNTRKDVATVTGK